MSRVIAVSACGFALAACSMSMPSLDFFKSAPATEVLRVESEPPGADARTTQGQSCRTPCELTVQSGGELGVSFALNGYQPQTLQVRAEAVPGAGYGESGTAKLQPNPVYAELQPMKPPPAKKKSSGKRVAKKPAPAQPSGEPPETTGTTSSGSTSSGTTGTTSSGSSSPTVYQWPDPR